jgi:hypothetical protein
MQQPSRFRMILKDIWPTIYKVINTVLYFIITLIKSTVKDIFRMIKSGGIGE